MDDFTNMDPFKNKDLLVDDMVLERKEPLINKASKEEGKLFKSGYVVIAGRPNTGKSTLINTLAGMKLAITSSKPQTTRHNIMYIHNDRDSQIIFTDTPGLNAPKNKLNELMMESSGKQIKDADLILIITSPYMNKLTPEELEFCDRGKEAGKKIFLIINKVDMVQRDSLLPIIADYANRKLFDEIIPLSARSPKAVGRLLDLIKSYLHQGPQYYPEDYFTDQTQRILASEIIRETALNFTSDEIPHGIAVQIAEFDDNSDNLTRIKANLICEKDSHKKIIIGSKGEAIKRIGTVARQDLENMMEKKVYLELFVKVKKNWRNDLNALKEFGYHG